MMKIFDKKWLKKLNWPYAVYKELKILRAERKSLWAEAVSKFEEEKTLQGSLNDYKNDLFQHRFSFVEYSGYRLWDMTDKERNGYISEKEMRCIYRKTVGIEASKWFDNKLVSHIKFEQFMQRAWLCPSLCSLDSFKQFITSRDCIIKPWKGSLGNGVFMVKKGDKVDLDDLYEHCRKENLFVEERIQSCCEIAEFHPQSLNTIRVMTMANEDRCEIVAAELRMGIGDLVVDNGAVGGILAPIDSSTGLIVGDGMDKMGHIFIQHPDSLKTIKGFCIPFWENVVEACKKMANLVPQTKFAGWDLCVCENGQIEMIEVNPCPNVMGLQLVFGQGLKPRIQELGKELYGYDLMKLIHVYKKPKLNYYENKLYLRHYRDPDTFLKDFVEYQAHNDDKG